MDIYYDMDSMGIIFPDSLLTTSKKGMMLGETTAETGKSCMTFASYGNRYLGSCRSFSIKHSNKHSVPRNFFWPKGRMNKN